VLVGVSLGVIVGQWAWRTIAEATPLVLVAPWAGLAIALAGPAALGVAAIVAFLPARRAARLRPADELVPRVALRRANTRPSVNPGSNRGGLTNNQEAGMGNLEVVQAIYQAMAARDAGAMFERFAPDCVVVQDPRLPWGGRWEGHEGLTEFALTLVGNVDSQVHTEAIYESDDEHVVQFGRTVGTIRTNGTPFDVSEMHLWRLRGGVVAEAHFAIDSERMLAALSAELPAPMTPPPPP
jgi:ketosteroid isomerase-like protein